jgi:hypothetical protein
MKITDDQTATQPLADFGAHATRLLCSGDFDALAKQFGYFLAYERDPAAAIQEELTSSLAEIGATSLNYPPTASPSVSYFKPNDTGLLALVEQYIPTNGNGHVLLELIVSSRNESKFIGLEQISSTPTTQPSADEPVCK